MMDGRWVNMALEDPWHPLPANPVDLKARGMTTQHEWPELHHVVSVEDPETKLPAWKMIRSEVLTAQPWSEPSDADARRGLPPIFDLSRDSWFGDQVYNGRIELGEISKQEWPNRVENFPHNHPLRDPNHTHAIPFTRAFPPRLDWTEVAKEDRRRRMAELTSASVASNVLSSDASASRATPNKSDDCGCGCGGARQLSPSLSPSPSVTPSPSSPSSSDDEGEDGS